MSEVIGHRDILLNLLEKIKKNRPKDYEDNQVFAMALIHLIKNQLTKSEDGKA